MRDMQKLTGMSLMRFAQSATEKKMSIRVENWRRGWERRG